MPYRLAIWSGGSIAQESSVEPGNLLSGSANPTVDAPDLGIYVTKVALVRAFEVDAATAQRRPVWLKAA
jgi:hypothetical protein